MHTKTKSKVLLGHTNDPREMLDSAVRLLKEAKLGPLRLIGVRMADFEKEREIESGQLRISDLLSRCSHLFLFSFFPFFLFSFSPAPARALSSFFPLFFLLLMHVMAQ